MRLATFAGDIVDGISKALFDTCPYAKKKFCELERPGAYQILARRSNVTVSFLLLHFQTLDGGFLQGRATFLAVRYKRRELGDVNVCVCGLNGLTAVQRSEDVDARLIVVVAGRRGQGLVSVLDKWSPST